MTVFGRISETGKSSSITCSSQNEAINLFKKQFRSKTGNTWENRKNFIKKPDKYFLTEISHDVKIDKKIDDKIINKPISKLDQRVQYLIELITNKQMMEKFLIKMDIDVKKAPLGKISTKQLDKALDVLKKIKNLGYVDVSNLCSEFYTLIPYSCGRRKPPLIDDDEMITKNEELIEQLKNMVVAAELLDNSNNNSNIHPIDNIYSGLNTNVAALDKKCDMWKHISNYIECTHGQTHKYKTELIDIYEINRNGEKELYQQCTKNIGNRWLLWHGSRMSNFASILQKGLLINPETLGVYISGKMFGGASIYTANCLSKSFNYCDSGSSNDIACLLLCEVALGNSTKRIHADYYITKQKLEKDGYNSTWGLGTTTPSSFVEVDGVKIPAGNMIKTADPRDLLYDEFIIYDQHQIMQKYLVIVRKI